MVCDSHKLCHKLQVGSHPATIAGWTNLSWICWFLCHLRHISQLGLIILNRIVMNKQQPTNVFRYINRTGSLPRCNTCDQLEAQEKHSTEHGYAHCGGSWTCSDDDKIVASTCPKKKASFAVLHKLSLATSTFEPYRNWYGIIWLWAPITLNISQGFVALTPT